MTERQANRPDPGDASGVAQDQPAVPPQAAREPAAQRPPGEGAGAERDRDRAGREDERADEAYSYGSAAGMGGVTAAISGLAWGAVLACALGVIAVGIMLLVWPHATLTVVALLIGAALLVAGVVRVADGLGARRESGGMRAVDVVVGLLAFLAGLYCLKHHALTIVVVALVVGAYWIIHGVGDLVVAASAPKGSGRGLRAVAGVFGIAAGTVVLFWPGISLVLLLTILGAWLLFYGVVLAGLAYAMRKASRQAKAARPARAPSAAPA